MEAVPRASRPLSASSANMIVSVSGEINEACHSGIEELK